MFNRMWGLTSVYAYRAYKDRSFLDDAIEIWQAYTPWVITPQDAANGAHPLKDAKFASECNGSKWSDSEWIFLKLSHGTYAGV